MKDSAYNLARECQVSASYLRYWLDWEPEHFVFGLFQFFHRQVLLSLLGLPVRREQLPLGLFSIAPLSRSRLVLGFWFSLP